MLKPMAYIQGALQQNKEERSLFKKAPLFVPAGQSTQMVVGATNETDLHVLHTADYFYNKMQLKRVYYSGYVPISADTRLPAIGTPVPMIRENRLYQADWLLRFYGFKVQEIISPEQPLLDLDIDPKLSWALRNLHLFPLDINKAELPLIKRIPGIGVTSALKIVAARRFNRLNWDNLKKLGIAVNRAKYFITCASPDFERKEYQPTQIRQFILTQGNSKYKPDLSPQMALF